MKDNFDDIVKNKWEQFHFPVDENHRQDMIALLDSQKKRRRGFFWLWSSIGAIVVVAALFVLLNNSTSLKGGAIPVRPNQDIEKQEVMAVAPNTKSVDDGSIANDNVPSQTSSSTTDVATRVNPATSTELSAQARTAIESLNSISSSSSSKANNNRNANSFDQYRVVIESNSLSTMPTVTAGSDDAIKQKNEKPLDIASSTGNNPELAVPMYAPESSVIAEDDKLIKAQSARNDFITEPVDLLEISQVDYTNDVTPYVSYTEVKHHPVRFFGEAGAGILFGSQPDFSSGWTINVGGGVDYGLYTKTHLALSGGYMLQSDGFDFEKTSTVNQESFGARSTFNTLAPKKLHFAYLRGGVHHRMHRHILSLFGSIQYLYGAQGELVTHTNDQLLGITDTTTKAWLKLDGMRRWNWSMDAQYGYQLSRKLSLHAGVRYNFTGIKANDPELEVKGFYWDGKISRLSPFFTINYQLYGTR